jgi:[ribosomal protein S18]-alanine N-acetyltransferase
MSTNNTVKTNQFRVRMMIDKDLDQVIKIDKMSFEIPWPDSSFKYELYKNPHSILLVAELLDTQQTTNIIGAIVVWLIVDEAHIATLAVHPEYRNKGVATKLLSEALCVALDKGMTQATLEVRANNSIAYKLYEHFGFEITGKRKNYYRDNKEDALIMTLRKLDYNHLNKIKTETNQYNYFSQAKPLE